VGWLSGARSWSSEGGRVKEMGKEAATKWQGSMERLLASTKGLLKQLLFIARDK
jgi:hypothetical protein